MKNYLTETWYRKNCPDDPPSKGTPVRFSTRPGPHRWSRSPKYYRNLAGQLEALNMGKFQGRQHSGIDVSIESTERRRTRQTILTTAVARTGRNECRTNPYGVGQAGCIVGDER